MNTLLLHRLVKAAPLAMAVFSIMLMAYGVFGVHGVHFLTHGDPGGNGGPNGIRFTLNGDPGGNGGPN